MTIAAPPQVAQSGGLRALTSFLVQEYLRIMRSRVAILIWLMIIYGLVSLLKSPQGRERLVIFAGQPYRRGHGVDSLRRCFALRLPFSQPRLAGN